MKANKILLLMSDQHRPDITGYEGNRVVRTPHLDWLAETGVQFRNAYTPSPICVPARQSMLAGQLPGRCGCMSFGDDLAPGSMTYPRRLAQYGFDSVVCGKLHLTGPDQMQGWTLRIGHDNPISRSAIEGGEGGKPGMHPRGQKGPGWSWAKEIRRAGVGRSPHLAKDEYTVRGAIDFIDERFLDPYYDRQDSDSSLLLKVSLRFPHYPFLTSEELFGHYLNRVSPFVDQHFFPHPVFAQIGSAWNWV